ncbi:MAG: hypothetical protein ACI8Z9_000906 [Paraglaciecola sp.]|jgi:hypothetical protein
MREVNVHFRTIAQSKSEYYQYMLFARTRRYRRKSDHPVSANLSQSMSDSAMAGYGAFLSIFIFTKYPQQNCIHTAL